MALLQSKEEILEAINADIVSNGKKGITGDILNLIFNSLVELIGKGSGGGGNVYNLPIGTMMATEEAPYSFTPEEAGAFKAAIADLGGTTFGIYADASTGQEMKMTFPIVSPQSTEDGSTKYGMFGVFPISASATILFEFYVVIASSGEVTGFFAQ